MRIGSKVYGNYLEEYKIVERKAEGGNSQVCKVKTIDGNIYALKLLNKNLSSEKIKRFKNEMAFCYKVSNPYIIKIIDNGITDDKSQMFYIMPFYEKTLRDFINESHNSEENIEMFMNILNGVNFYQSHDIIHRDIKPENILISASDNLPIISDFGIAHFSEDEIITSVQTKTGSKMANFQYASPEQREKGGVITKKSDIYSLGLIFNEMFTKKVPYGSGYKKITDVDKNFSFLDKVVDKMILQDPNQRFKSIDEIIYEINALIRINKKEKEITKLKEFKYLEYDENDILILEPPKLVDFKYNENTGELFLYLDKNVNQDWVDCMTKDSYMYLLSYGPEKFTFKNNVAILNLNSTYLDNLQKIIDYFKSWVDNANKYYPQLVRQQRSLRKQRVEEETRKKIEREEKIKNVLEKIHI